MNEAGCKANTGNSAAQEILAMLDVLGDKASDMEKFADARLSSITSMPQPPSVNECAPVRQLPPLFTEMREKIWRIESAIAGARDTISRCEL